MLEQEQEGSVQLKEQIVDVCAALETLETGGEGIENRLTFEGQMPAERQSRDILAKVAMFRYNCALNSHSLTGGDVLFDIGAYSKQICQYKKK